VPGFLKSICSQTDQVCYRGEPNWNSKWTQLVQIEPCSTHRLVNSDCTHLA